MKQTETNGRDTDGMNRRRRMTALTPIGLLSVAIVLNVVIVPIIASSEWRMYSSLSRVGTDELRLQRLAGKIAHLNESLTMYARMAAATGDPAWEDRYRELEPKLDSAITQVALLAREEYDRKYSAQTKLAYTRLIEMESVAFALTRQKRVLEAADLVFGDEYAAQKKLYSEGVNALIEAVQTRIDGELRLFRRRIWETGMLGVVGPVVLLASWIGVTLILRRHLRKRRAAEQALAEEKEHLAVTLRSIGDGVITADTTGRVVMMNRQAEDLTGWSQDEAVGKPVEEVFHVVSESKKTSVPSPVAQVLKNGRICEITNNTILVSKGGDEYIISHSAAPIRDSRNRIVGVVAVFRDMTERRRMQNELVRAEKLESVGILAGGIAHDFNNILTVIMGNISLAKAALERAGHSTERLNNAENACRRAKDLTHQLMTFAKGGAPIKQTTTVGRLLVDWTTFALQGSNVKCEFRIDDDLRSVDIDESQISQVINNLVINADQAMPGGGMVEVSARNVVVTEEDGLGLEAGEYVVMSVRDEGVGVAPEHLPKIFDPYFTTKQSGMGLGLATSYSTVRRHDGHITVDSKPGVGTRFDVYLPASEGEPPQPLHPAVHTTNGKGKILVMDDDEAVRFLVGEMLSSLGYRVAMAVDGSEAIAKYKESREQGAPFDLVIMDLTVRGGMGGKEAVKRLTELDPDVKAIVSSGYSNDPIMAEYQEYGFCGVLAKPYDVESLSRTLRGALS